MNLVAILEYIAMSVYGLGRLYSYSGDLSAGTQAAYDALVWTDSKPKPSWALILASVDLSAAWHTKNPASVSGVAQADTLAVLRAITPVSGMKVFLAGKSALGDGFGGFYYWDGLSTAAEDLVYMNVIISNFTNTGRWRRVFSKITSYTQGLMVNAGGVLTFYASTVTDATGQAKIFLTDNNLATGNALFKEVWENTSRAKTTAATPADAVQSYTKQLGEAAGVDLLSTVHGYYKANPVTMAIGLVYSPYAAVGAGVPVQFAITGI